MKRITFTLTIALAAGTLLAQPAHRAVPITVTLKQYLALVAKGNLSYAAQQYNVSIAQAELSVAHVFPDPELSFSYSNNQNITGNMGKGIETGISYPFSLGNKRGAAISLAKNLHEQSQSALEAFYQALRADATLGFLSAVRDREMLALQQDTYTRMRKLAEGDSIRLKTGAIMEIDAMQSALEATAQQGEVLQAEDDVQGSLIAITRLRGTSTSDTIMQPADGIPIFKRNFTFDQLLKSALDQRSDLKVAAKEQEVAKAKIRQLKANRAFEFSLEAGYAHTAEVTNESAPAPALTTYKAGITIPLKFSSFNRSEVRAAKLAALQAELSYRDMEQQVVADVAKAYSSYLSAEKQLEHYGHGIVENADKILQGRIYSYQRGESGLIDVLAAQRAYNDLRKDYVEAQFRYASALVELERAVGIWDIE